MPDSFSNTSLWQRLRRSLSGDPWRIDRAAASLVGARDENQDNYLLLADAQAEYLVDAEPCGKPVPDWPADRVRVMVFDGMGGHRDGRQVAEAAAQAAVGLPPQHSESALRDALKMLHQGLVERFHRSDEPGSPGATVVWLEIDCRRRRAWIAQVGDSRIYRLRDGRWQCLTHDHTLIEFNWRDGDIDHARYAELSVIPGQRLVQAIGYGSWGILPDDRGIKPYTRDSQLRLDLADELPVDRAGHADVRELSLQPGDCLLLASDGLWDPVANGLWQGPETVAVGRSAVNALVQDAVAKGGRDNVTAVLVGVGIG